MIIDAHYHLDNGIEYAIFGDSSPYPLEVWAYISTTNYLRVYQIDASRFCELFTDDGTFRTIAGTSPNGTGHVPDGLTGTYVYRAISYVTATRSAYNAQGDLGSSDAGCVVSRDRRSYSCRGCSSDQGAACPLRPSLAYFTSPSLTGDAYYEGLAATNGSTLENFATHGSNIQKWDDRVVGDIVAGSAPAKNACPDYYVIDSRGPGERPGAISRPGMQFINAFKHLKPNWIVRYTPNPYRVPGWKSFVGAALHQNGAAYSNSVSAGEAWLRHELGRLSARCRTTKLIVTGHGEGAQVTGNVAAANWPNLIGVVLFGDPLFNGSDRAADRGAHENGPLGARPKFAPRGGQVVLSYCHKDDPVCQKGVSLVHEPSHRAYDKSNDPTQAARAVAVLT